MRLGACLVEDMEELELLGNLTVRCDFQIGLVFFGVGIISEEGKNELVVSSLGLELLAGGLVGSGTNLLEDPAVDFHFGSASVVFQFHSIPILQLISTEFAKI